MGGCNDDGGADVAQNGRSGPAGAAPLGRGRPLVGAAGGPGRARPGLGVGRASEPKPPPPVPERQALNNTNLRRSGPAYAADRGRPESLPVVSPSVQHAPVTD